MMFKWVLYDLCFIVQGEMSVMGISLPLLPSSPPLSHLPCPALFSFLQEMVVIHCLSSEASAPPITPVAPIAAHVPPPKHLNFTAIDVLSRLIVLLVKVRGQMGYQQ